MKTTQESPKIGNGNTKSGTSKPTEKRYKLSYYIGGKVVNTLIQGNWPLCKWKQNQARLSGDCKMGVLKIEVVI